MTKPRLPFGLNPFYAVVGMTDLAARRLSEIGAEVRGETMEPTDNTKVQLARFARGVRQMPLLALNEWFDVVTRSQSQFSQLAERGENVVRRQPQVKQSEELLARAGRSVARGQENATRAAHNAADRTRAGASTAMTQAREQADHVTDEVVEAVTHVAQFGRQTAAPLLRRGSVARPVREATADAAQAVEQTARPKPRRPRLNSAAQVGSGVEAGATVTTTKKSAAKSEESADKRDTSDKTAKTVKSAKRASAAASGTSRTTTAPAGRSTAKKATTRRRAATAKATASKSAAAKKSTAKAASATPATEAPASTATTATTESTES